MSEANARMMCHEQAGYECIPMEDVLKPCPFCGYRWVSPLKRWIDDRTIEGAVSCKRCGMTFRFFDTCLYPKDVSRDVREDMLAKAITVKWNTRRVPAPVDKLADVIRELEDFTAKEVYREDAMRRMNAIRANLIDVMSEMYSDAHKGDSG